MSFHSYWISTPQGPSPFLLTSSPMISIDNLLSFESNPALPPQGVSDMIQMQILNEPELLNNLKLRYSQSQIFTYIGPSLLIMNPYCDIPELLSEAKLLEILETRDISQPNIYSIALNTMLLLENNLKNQAIVITGESGAGKTETTKHCMKFLTFQRKKSLEKSISQKILDCNPILEAFGNAKTVRNDNSSRFGKYVRLLISRKKTNENSGIQGATISSYLLEKSRVLEQAKNERNYHIFYYLLNGIEEKQRKSMELEGFSMESLNYLNKSQCFQVANIDDKRGFHEVMQSFEDLGFNPCEIQEILEILTGILLLGNLEFSNENLSDTMSCLIKSLEIMTKICKLFKINEKSLEKTLVWKIREVGKQEILSPLNLNDCEGLRDSLAKNLYEKLFSWLVKKLNLTVFPEEIKGISGTSSREVRKSIKIIKKTMLSGETNRNSIGLLDIFGFENFDINSFEQLCINFTNEKLQQLYIAYIYKSEENELLAQGFDLSYLDFQDNQQILDLIEKYPISILDLLDESTALNSSNDENLLNSFNKSLGNNSFFKPNLQTLSFQISHTAKNVNYSIKGFRTKNRDEITREIEDLMINSGNLVIKEAFSGEKEPMKKKKFLAGKFKGQIRDLMNELGLCDVSFVRCLKPNEEKKAGFFNENFVLLQIRYLGLIDSIRIRQKGYEIRRNYQDFYFKFRDLLIKPPTKGLENNLNELKEALISYFRDNWPQELEKRLVLLGKTKIFLKNSMVKTLDSALKEANRIKAENLKKILRQYNIYKFKKKLKFGIKGLRMVFKAIIKLQSKRKALKERKRFLQKKKAIKIIEKILKLRELKKDFLRFEEKGVLIEKIRKKRKAFIRIMEVRKKRNFKEYFMKFVGILKLLVKKKTVRFSEFQKKTQCPSEIEEKELKTPENSRKSILKPQSNENKEEPPYSSNKDEDPQIFNKKNELSFIEKPKISQFLKKENSIPLLSFPDFNSSNIENAIESIPSSYVYHFDNLFTSRDSLMIGNFSNIPKSLDCYLDFSSLDQEFLQTIKNNDFLLKAGEILQKQRKWLKVLSKDQILSYQKTPITSSLQKLSEKNTLISQKIFKLILQYCYELPSSSNLSNKVLKLLAIIQSKPLEPELIDETYLLLIKQLRNNQKSSNALRVYRLLGLVSSVRPPSIRLLFPILNFLYKKANEIDEKREELECLKYSISKIIDGSEKGMRKIVPCENEMALIEFRKTIQVPINFMNGGCLILNIEPYTTIKEIIAIILKKLEKTKLSEYFGLYEICWKNSMVFSENFLENEAFILDRVNLIEKLKSSIESQALSKPKMKFFLRIRVFYKFLEQDLDTIDLLYSQYLSDISAGKYFFSSDEELAEIMGIALFLDYGAFSIEKSGKLTINLERYIPADKLLKKGTKYWFETLMRSYEEVKEGNMMKLRFLRVLQEKDVFFAHHFIGTYAKIEGKSDIAVKKEKEDSWIVIKPLILQVIKMKNEEKMTYEFDKIVKWGKFEDKSLVIYTNDGLVHVISSVFCLEIEYLIKNYIRIAIKLSNP